MGLGNLVLFIFSIFFMVNRKFSIIKSLKDQKVFLLIIISVVTFHVIEVNFIDSYATSFVGRNFAPLFQSFEDGLIAAVSHYWSMPLLIFFVLVYIVIYPFTLWFSPLLFLINENKKAMKSLAYGLLSIYILSLPFYLFLPVTNVYTYYGIHSALNSIIPSIENFFYHTTTQNNCFPSLHVAMTLLIAKSSSFTKNKRYKYFTYILAVTVIMSVLYLSIHWITDVIGGVVVFLIASAIINYMNRVERDILTKIVPTIKDRKRINDTVRTLIERVKNECSKMKLNVIPKLVGSVAKDTYLKNSVDIDLFLLFPKNTPREELERNGLDIGRKILEDTEERYAEHPYVRGIFNDYITEIVPCYHIKSAEKKVSAVDRTPFHTEYVREHLRIWRRNDVRLLKQFMKGIGCYGAEAEVEGFSGYLCELLIIKYGSFRSVLRNAQNWKDGMRIKIKDTRRDVYSFNDPLVVIDPVDPNRNVASALSREKLHIFIRASREYLKESKISFFFPNKIKLLPLSKIRKKIDNQSFIGIKIPKLNIISDNLFPQIRKSLKSISNYCEREGFKIINTAFEVGKDSIYLILSPEKLEIESTKIHKGPPDKEEEHVKSFINKWSRSRDTVRKPYKVDGIWYVEIRREYTKLENLLRDKLRYMGLGKDIYSSIEKGFKIIPTSGLVVDELREFWTRYFDKRMPWDR